MKLRFIGQLNIPFDKFIAVEFLRRAQAYPSWDLQVTKSTQVAYQPNALSAGQIPQDVDMVLGMWRNEQECAFVRAMGCPALNFSANCPSWNSHCVCVDNRATGALIAEEFSYRGYRYVTALAFAMTSGLHAERMQAFVERSGELGLEMLPEVEFSMNEHGPLLEKVSRQGHGEPIGIFAPTPDLAAYFITRLRQQGIKVPQQVAVISVDSDDFSDAVCGMEISNVRSDYRLLVEKGIEVIRQFEEGVLDGTSPVQVKVPPLDVEHGQTTVLTAVQQPVLRQALAWIDEHLEGGGGPSEAMRVGTIAQVCGVSRRSLEVLFREHIRMGVGEYVRHCRLEDAKRMLRKGDASIDLIAEQVGYVDRASFHTAFKKHVGLSPGRYRTDYAPKKVPYIQSAGQH